jgi:hypothetical protein
MQFNGNHKRFRSAFSCLRYLRPCSLHSFALALLVLLPLGFGNANAAPPSGASSVHVYMLRGVLNIFSLGLDDIAAQLEQKGIPVTIANYLSWSYLADEAAAEYKSGKIRTIILVGHSSGATALPDMVARLDRRGAPVKLAIGLDSVFRTSLEGHVGRYINYYIANGSGEPVNKTSRLHGALENVDVQKIPGVGHLTIDKNKVIQQRVINAIDAAIYSRSKSAISPKESARPEMQAGAANKN